MKLLAVRRLLRIQRVVIRYRLDDLLFALPLPWFLLALRYALPWRWFPRKTLDLSRGARLRLALQDLGPIFIKFGQILSTRRDLLPEDIADELMKLQDRVPPFDSQVSVKLIEEQLGKKISEVFSRFDVEPLASASVAQVHAAQLKTGEEVVVKVIRPGLKPIIAQDLAWLFILARAAEKLSADARLLHPVDVVQRLRKNHLRRTRPAARSGQRQPVEAQLRRLAAALRAASLLGLVPAESAGDGAHLRDSGHRPGDPGRPAHRHENARRARRGDLLHPGVPRQLLPRRHAPRQHLRQHRATRGARSTLRSTAASSAA